jgi:tRNA 2-selenouridine synthase
LDITEFLDKSFTLPVIDVRSPAEFEHGHIPCAVNLPLFTNEERSIIGTLYLQKGTSDAMLKGLELIGPKMKSFAEMALTLAPEKEVLLHCWRGGMRSNSMAWLMNTIGLKTGTLEGGYKAYRRHVQASFEHPVNLIVIGGMTGSGKTEVLEALESQGKQVIHLERLARHKGSVFGSIGMPAQPSTEQFENELSGCLRQLNIEEPVFIEDESLTIGKVFIPKSFFRQMSAACLVNLAVPVHRRVHRLVSAYTDGNRDLLISGVRRIGKRLGLRNAALAIELIQKGSMSEAVELVLRYYDKLYVRSMVMHRSGVVREIIVNKETPAEIADKIIDLTQQPQPTTYNLQPTT